MKRKDFLYFLNKFFPEQIEIYPRDRFINQLANFLLKYEIQLKDIFKEGVKK